MEITAITPLNESDWLDIREQCYDFISRFGSRRLTHEGLSSLQNMSLQQLQQPGTSLIAATVRGEYGRMPVGICYVTGFGETACLIAIHPLYRDRRIGTSLILSQQSRLGYLCCKVAADNYSSLHICFDAGMYAIALESNPAGKPTLVMISGSADSTASAGAMNDLDSDSTQEGEILCLNRS